MSFKLLVKSFVIAIALLVSGCGTPSRHVYDGPERPRSELAVIFANMANPGLHAHFTQVDGHLVSISGPPKEVLVLPGKHQLLLFVTSGFKSGNIPIAVEVRAGHTYEVTYGTDGSASVGYGVIDRGPN